MFHELPEWAADAVHVHMESHFDWRDRIRLFLTGVLYAEVQVFCEHEPGRTESIADVRPKRLIRRHPIAFVTTDAPAPEEIQNS